MLSERGECREGRTGEEGGRKEGKGLQKSSQGIVWLFQEWEINTSALFIVPSV